jgi:ATP-dependent helicase HrpB
VPILPLHGQVEPAAQRAAIRRDPEGRRRIVLGDEHRRDLDHARRVAVVVDAACRAAPSSTSPLASPT